MKEIELMRAIVVESDQTLAWREVPVQVKMGLDADGVIQAEVRDVQSGKTKAITLNRHG